MKGEFIIFLLRFVIISQRRRTQFLSKISSLPTFFVAPFLDYSAPLKSCIPKIAVSQLSWALKFHSATSNPLHLCLSFLFLSLYFHIPTYKQENGYEKDSKENKVSFGTLSKFNSTSPVYGLLRNMSLYGLNLSTVGAHYIYDLEIIGEV